MKRLELLGRGVAGAGLSAYCVGFVVVNMQLANRGVFYAELFRAEYVAAGLLWLSLVAIPATLILFVSTRITMLLPRHRSTKREAPGLLMRLGNLLRYEPTARGAIFEACFIIVLTLGALNIILTVLNGTDASYRASAMPTEVLICATAVLMLALLAAIRPRNDEFWRRMALRWTNDESGIVLRVMVSTDAFVVLIVLMWVYATFAYPSFYRVVGGGYRQPVRISVNHDAESILVMAKVPVRNGQILVPMTILLETATRTVIARVDDESEAISIPSASVAGVLYHGPLTLDEARMGVRHPFRTWWNFVIGRIRRPLS